MQFVSIEKNFIEQSMQFMINSIHETALVAQSHAHPTGDQENAGSIFKWQLIMKFYGHSLPSADQDRQLTVTG